MKNRLLHASHSRSGTPTSGFVLVTVLIVLVLLVVLVVAFLARVTTEQTSASGFRGAASARELGDMAVGLVQGQIGLATAQSPTNAWVSQPGMVRTYDANGNFYNAFKLYSSTNMILTNAAGLGIVAGVSPDAPSTTWTNDVAFWTDLNAPVTTPSGMTNYPIVDRGATNTVTGPSGFTVTAAPGATANQPIPMPVRWLYVLEDGSLVAPTGSGATATVAGETSSNKIIGRIAFWTDDDTCRVNINTASTGTFWDVPRAYSTNTFSGSSSGTPISGSLTQEQALGYYQPTQKEFQRYPGHPAMTDLRAVFPTLTQTNIYSIVPRVVGGGSTQGTVQVLTNSTLAGYPKNNRLYANVDELLFSTNRGPNPASPATGLTLPQLQTAKFFLTAQSRAPEVNLFGLPRVACWPINADYNPVSKPTSPYTTAFDRLIAECSTVGNTTKANTYYPYYFQRQNALSAINDISITRNQTLYKYLHYLTGRSIPGFGGNFQTKYPSPDGALPTDCDQILTEIFDYIRSTNLYDTTLDPVPDTSPTSAGKYEFTGNGVTGSLVGTNIAPVAHGYVVPSVVSPAINGEGTSSTQGFGRSYTLANLGIGFICNADGNGTNSIVVNGLTNNPPTNNVPPFNNASPPWPTVGTGTQWPFSTNQPPSAMILGASTNFDDYAKISNNTKAETYQVEGTTNSVTFTPNLVLGGTALQPGQKYVQAIIVPEFFSVMAGFVSIWPNMTISVSGLRSLSVTGADGNPNYLFPYDTEPNAAESGGTLVPLNYHDLRPDGRSSTTGGAGWTTFASFYGGNPNWRYFTMGQIASLITSTGSGRGSPARGNLPADLAYELYPLIGQPVVVSDTDTPATGYPSGTMAFSGGKVTVTISDHYGNLVQTINITLPQATFPTPQLVTLGTPVNQVYPSTLAQQWWAYTRGGPMTNTPPRPGRLGFVGPPPTAGGSLTAVPPSLVPVSATPATDYFSGIFLRPDFDVLRTVAPPHGDYRLIAGMNVVPYGVFLPHRYYSDATQMFASTLNTPNDTRNDPGYDTAGQYISTVPFTVPHQPDISYYATTNGPPLTPQATQDYDNPLPDIYPGPYANKPDEGSVPFGVTGNVPYYYATQQSSENGSGVDQYSDGGAFFSPNRMMPSPGMFGSLPTGVMAGVPWRTLLFRPQGSNYGVNSHYGATSPADHLLLDLFWMPVVEPYAISDRFSTAGKINMNYQILPFTYMKRSTGLYALFQSEMVTAIPSTENNVFKQPSANGFGTKKVLRDQIDSAATLGQFDTKFSIGDVFKSASEICNLEIVPDGGTLGATPGVNSPTTMPAYWTNNILTGDNVRERIYTTLYPRLTTKSNTYTVYYKAQALKKAATSAYGTWTEGTDIVAGEYRGSANIERFIDANNASIPDYASDAAAGTIASDPTLDTFYRWRIISNRQFAP